jgi:hypothetical protein
MVESHAGNQLERIGAESCMSLKAMQVIPVGDRNLIPRSRIYRPIPILVTAEDS